MIDNVKKKTQRILNNLHTKLKDFCASVKHHWALIPISQRKIIKYISFGGILFLAMVLLGFHYFSDHESFVANIFTTAIGMVVTILIIEQLAKLRDEKHERQTLIFQLGSPNKLIATEAARLLRLRGWHNDGSLIGVHLANANLKGANLYQFDLRDAYLQSSDLSKVNLTNAQLSGANLASAKLEKASLKNAYMMNVNVIKADFTEADLLNVDDRGVDWSTAKSLYKTLRDVSTNKNNSLKESGEGED